MHKRLKILISTIIVSTNILIPSAFALDEIKTEVISQEQIQKIKEYTHKIKTSDSFNLNNNVVDNTYNSSVINYGNIGYKEIVNSDKKGNQKSFILTFENELPKNLDAKTKEILNGTYSLNDLLQCRIIHCSEINLESLLNKPVTSIICNNSNKTIVLCNSHNKITFSFPQYLYTICKGMIDNSDTYKLFTKVDNKCTYTIKPSAYTTNLNEKSELHNRFRFAEDKSKINYAIPRANYTVRSIVNNKCIKLNKKWVVVKKSLIGDKEQSSKYRKYVKCFINKNLVYSDDNNNVDILVSSNLALIDDTIIDLDKILATINISKEGINHFTVEVTYSPLMKGQNCMTYENSFDFTTNTKDSHTVGTASIKDKSMLNLYNILTSDKSHNKSYKYIPLALLLLLNFIPMIIVDMDDNKGKVKKVVSNTKKLTDSKEPTKAVLVDKRTLDKGATLDKSSNIATNKSTITEPSKEKKNKSKKAKEIK